MEFKIFIGYSLTCLLLTLITLLLILIFNGWSDLKEFLTENIQREEFFGYIFFLLCPPFTIPVIVFSLFESYQEQKNEKLLKRKKALWIHLKEFGGDL